MTELQLAVFGLVSSQVTAVTWPWVDAKGFVRVGLNHRLDTVDDALALDWRLANGLSGSVPSSRTIADAWERVAHYRPRGRKAKHRARGQAILTPIRLTDTGLDASFRSDMLSVYRALRRQDREFDDLCQVDTAARIAMGIISQ